MFCEMIYVALCYLGVVTHDKKISPTQSHASPRELVYDEYSLDSHETETQTNIIRH